MVKSAPRNRVQVGRWQTTQTDQVRRLPQSGTAQSLSLASCGCYHPGAELCCVGVVARPQTSIRGLLNGAVNCRSTMAERRAKLSVYALKSTTALKRLVRPVSAYCRTGGHFTAH